MNIRQENWNIIAENKTFDVVIMGAGINGSSIFKKLSQQGYKVLLVDKSDFSCGTSQASAMMVWGGLLYLKNLDLLSVYNFSKDRDKLISLFSDQVTAKHFRYIANGEWGRNKYLVYMALHFYWMLGRFTRTKPILQTQFAEADFIHSRYNKGSIRYQEGFLKYSDSRFVLDWILSHQSEETIALNYCHIEEGQYHGKDKFWSLSLQDTVNHRSCTIKAKLILNCGGVWTDKINQQFGIQSPYKHVFSKGVFLGYERPDTHDLPLVFESGENGDTMTFIPWGPISLWGPTETIETSIESGYAVTQADIQILLKHASRNLQASLTTSKIISVRCGLRPLAVARNFVADCYPLDISRYHRIFDSQELPWMAIYGGKISGCISLADEVARKIAKKIPPNLTACAPLRPCNETMSWASFPYLSEKVPAIDWCIEQEFCCTLEDYLRRRTNIAQWIPREGLGFHDEHREYLEKLARHLPKQAGKQPADLIGDYAGKVHERFDKLMESI